MTTPFEPSIPFGKLICIGKNYAKHAAEMKSAVPTEPVVFLKPRTAIIRDGDAVVLPPLSVEVHHEVELVALIGRRGKDIPEAEALSYVSGYAVGLDMTARDLQAKAKRHGHPWSVAKGFDTFAPLGSFVPAAAVADVQEVMLTLKVNGAVRQKASTREMVFTVANLIAYCSEIFTLEPGDCLFTGTPEGVAAVQPGDRLECTGSGLQALTVTVRAQGQT